MGKHGIGKCNSNGELLLAMCSEFELIVAYTMFKQNEERKKTWMHPRSRLWHMIDFIITRCRNKMDVHSTRAMRGANCWTDHQILRSKVAFLDANPLLSRHIFHSDGTSLVHSYYINYADNVKYMTVVDKLGKVRNIYANILENIKK